MDEIARQLLKEFAQTGSPETAVAFARASLRAGIPEIIDSRYDSHDPKKPLNTHKLFGRLLEGENFRIKDGLVHQTYLTKLPFKEVANKTGLSFYLIESLSSDHLTSHFVFIGEDPKPLAIFDNYVFFELKVLVDITASKTFKKLQKCPLCGCSDLHRHAYHNQKRQVYCQKCDFYWNEVDFTQSNEQPPWLSYE